MKKYFFLFLVAICSFSVFSQEKVTTYYLIRHAEKDRTNANNKNPNLTYKGTERAKKWAEVFSNVKLNAIYSTDFRRTKQTAKPTAESKKLPIYAFDTKAMYDAGFKYNTSGKSVLVVGHSNTTPQLANMILGEEKYKQIKDTNNGNLYIITIIDDKKSSTLLKIN